MNDVYIEALINKTFNQDGNESASLKVKYYNPHDLLFQHLPLKQKARNIEDMVNRKKNKSIVDVLTSVDIPENL